MVDTEFQIKSSKDAPKVDTSTWPLLLKVRPPFHMLIDPNKVRLTDLLFLWSLQQVLYGQGESKRLGVSDDKKHYQTEIFAII